MKKKINYTAVSNHIISWIKNYPSISNTKGFTIGISGGIDSAVVSTLCAKTGLPLLVMEMPIHQAQGEVDRAEKHIQWLMSNYPNVSRKKIELTDVYDTTYEAYATQANNISKEDFDFSMANTRARLRMTTLYHFAGMYKMLVAGTGNKVEDFGIGFYTKFGDGGVDFSPIADLMKTEVYELGAELGLLTELLNAVPTDGLHGDGRTDEDQIGASYPELEWAMDFEKEQNGKFDPQQKEASELVLSDREREVLKIYRKFHYSNLHKMLEIPVCLLNDNIKYS